VTDPIQLICSRCDAPADPLDWRCTTCGGPLEIANLPAFNADAIRQHEWSIWRYAAMLPTYRRFSLGEGMTPLVPVKIGSTPFLAKQEYLSPTASYKDRGTAVLLNYLLEHGVTSVVEDSSGNAGASLAAYSGGIGLEAEIYVPDTAPAGKKTQISRFGAQLVAVEGSRADVTTACEQAAATSTYASHAWNPLFIAGQMTCAWEIWEQMGQRAPGAIVCPVGQGGLLLGLARGFTMLLDAGLIDNMPRLYGVQSTAYDSVVRAWENGSDQPDGSTQGDTVADGIRIAQPVRGQAVMAAIGASDGAAFRVEDERILEARTALALQGLFVEPTSAVAVAALPQVMDHLGDLTEIVIPLTGSGLKGTQG
jgi:threonine synthase